MPGAKHHQQASIPPESHISVTPAIGDAAAAVAIRATYTPQQKKFERKSDVAASPHAGKSYVESDRGR